MKIVWLITILFVLFLSGNVFANADAIVGDWYTAEETSVIHISKCGDTYCGKIVWLKNPKAEDGTDKVDFRNPDDKLKSRKLMGLDILTGFKYKNENKWESGKIYDPKNGKTYSCKITLEGNELKVRGYIGFSLLGRTTVWTRKAS